MLSYIGGFLSQKFSYDQTFISPSSSQKILQTAAYTGWWGVKQVTFFSGGNSPNLSIRQFNINNIDLWGVKGVTPGQGKGCNYISIISASFDTIYKKHAFFSLNYYRVFLKTLNFFLYSYPFALRQCCGFAHYVTDKGT